MIKLQELMSSLSAKTPPKFMLWVGQEVKIQDLYIDKIVSLGYEKVICDTVPEALSEVSKQTFNNIPKLCLVSYDSDYMKAGEDKWKKAIEIANSSDSVLLIKYTLVNKKFKFYKIHEPYTVEFNKLSKEVLSQYITKEFGGGFKDSNGDKLIDMCNYDYGRILLEIDKIKQYSKSIRKPDYNAIFEQFVAEEVIYEDIGDITFKLTDSILGGYPEAAEEYLRKAKIVKEPALRVCSILYTGFRNLLSYKGLGRNKVNASNRTGLTGWQVRQCINWDGGYNIEELLRNMLLCQKVEKYVKIGKLDDKLALDYLVVNCMK